MSRRLEPTVRNLAMKPVVSIFSKFAKFKIFKATCNMSFETTICMEMLTALEPVLLFPQGASGKSDVMSGVKL